ncbi:MAG TPA: aminopeptidase [Solirubrobacteraceae bacterium]|nr:aminopeptidase [Solirubrobacteraceae bacterium]
MSVREETLDRLAELAVTFGANVQPGQVLAVGAELGQEPIVRAIARSAYKHGAKFVDVAYWDMWVKRERLLHAAEDTLDFVPSWYSHRLLQLGEQRCARIGLSGTAHPHALDGVDPERAGRDQLPFLREAAQVVNDRTTNWSAIAGPSPGWARLVHAGLPPEEAEERLWQQILHVLRLDEDDPVAVWQRRADTLTGAAARLTERRFDALHFEGPGTDLTVGLLPSSSWMAARFETVDGIVHMPNLPSEEVFTTPDPRRVDGHVRSTKPLELHGAIIRGLRVRFEGGRAVSVEADENGDVLARYAQRDAGACRLGEVALVDAEGRIGALDTVFYDTLLDENAASHIALGSAYRFTVDDEADRERANTSEIHVDFMIGSLEVRVTGIGSDGERVPVLVDGRWRV